MAFVPVPKDLNRVKTKVMFNLTKRQLICFSVAAAVGTPVFFLTKSSLGLSTAAMLMVVIMLPFIFFALYEKDGQPAEKILGHVREEIDKCVAEVMEHITDTLDSFIDKEQMMHCADFPFAEAEDSDETVTLPKEKYDLMVEDLLTMAELIEMVSDMRTKDVRIIGELGKYVPAFAAFEKGRLSLYREAAKEAEEIVERWDEELDDDYEPDEYFSD